MPSDFTTRDMQILQAVFECFDAGVHPNYGELARTLSLKNKHVATNAYCALRHKISASGYLDGSAGVAVASDDDSPLISIKPVAAARKFTASAKAKADAGAQATIEAQATAQDGESDGITAEKVEPVVSKRTLRNRKATSVQPTESNNLDTTGKAPSKKRKYTPKPKADGTTITRRPVRNTRKAAAQTDIDAASDDQEVEDPNTTEEAPAKKQKYTRKTKAEASITASKPVTKSRKTAAQTDIDVIGDDQEVEDPDTTEEAPAKKQKYTRNTKAESSITVPKAVRKTRKAATQTDVNATDDDQEVEDPDTTEEAPVNKRRYTRKPKAKGATRRPVGKTTKTATPVQTDIDNDSDDQGVEDPDTTEEAPSKKRKYTRKPKAKGTTAIRRPVGKTTKAVTPIQTDVDDNSDDQESEDFDPSLKPPTYKNKDKPGEYNLYPDEDEDMTPVISTTKTGGVYDSEDEILFRVDTSVFAAKADKGKGKAKI